MSPRPESGTYGSARGDVAWTGVVERSSGGGPSSSSTGRAEEMSSRSGSRSRPYSSTVKSGFAGAFEPGGRGGVFALAAHAALAAPGVVTFVVSQACVFFVCCDVLLLGVVCAAPADELTPAEEGHCPEP